MKKPQMQGARKRARRRYGNSVAQASDQATQQVRFFQRGFTLFEMMLVILLVATVSVALLQAISTGLFAGRENENEAVAANLAQEKIEEMRNRSFSNIASETRAVISGFSPYERETLVSTVQTGLKQITVNVYWTSKSAQLSSSMISYASDI